MTQEEKAKAYDEAYKKAKDMLSYKEIRQEDVEYLFPELAESEDERMRKIITLCLEECVHSDIIRDCEKDDAIAWLEKQGEKPTEEYNITGIGSKNAQGKLGEMIKNLKHDNEVLEQKPTDKYEGLTDFERTLADICVGWIGEEYGWKQYIKDNADVLLKIAIKKFNSVQDAHFEQKPAEEYNITGIGSKHAEGKLGEMIKNLKNDNEVLEQKSADEEMKEALRTEYEKGRADVIAEIQKPAWSKEDEEFLSEIISDIKFAQDKHPDSQMNQIIFEEEVTWLKSLKQRIGE